MNRPHAINAAMSVALEKAIDEFVPTGYKMPKEFIRTDRVHRHDNGKADYTWTKAAVTAGRTEEE